MASTVATPLERQLGRIAGVNEITSSSSLGSSRITLQFDLSRNINDAATEVQSAINAARSQLPTACRTTRPTAKVNPADGADHGDDAHLRHHEPRADVRRRFDHRRGRSSRRCAASAR
jgi:hypothetical protein